MCRDIQCGCQSTTNRIHSNNPLKGVTVPIPRIVVDVRSSGCSRRCKSRQGTDYGGVCDYAVMAAAVKGVNEPGLKPIADYLSGLKLEQTSHRLRILAPAGYIRP